MTKHLQTLAIAALLLVPASAAHAQVSIGIRIGDPPAPRAYRVPPRPNATAEWVEGYSYPQGKNYKWHDGYWTQPPYKGASWAAPYNSGGQYFAGQWEGNGGNVAHDHRSDRSATRDAGRAPHTNNHDDNRR